MLDPSTTRFKGIVKSLPTGFQRGEIPAERRFEKIVNGFVRFLFKTGRANR
jgi:hypothetical protein